MPDGNGAYGDDVTIDGAGINRGALVFTCADPGTVFAGSFSSYQLKIHLAAHSDTPRYVDNVKVYSVPALDLSGPASASAGDRVTLDTSGGEPGNPVLMFVAAVNGVPLLTRVASGSFDVAGVWTVAGTVPAEPTLPGNTLTLHTFALGPNQQIVESNDLDIQFQ